MDFSILLVLLFLTITAVFWNIGCSLEGNAVIQVGAAEKVANYSGHEQEQLLTRQARQVLVNDGTRWPDATVPYIIPNDTFSESMAKLIQESMDEFHKFTCVRFIRRTTERDYIIFRSKERCKAHLGRSPGETNCDLKEEGCKDKGTILHELMHVLGFIHEHQRPDRDDYVTIMTDNFDKEFNPQFTKFKRNKVKIFGNYSYESIMHYDAFAFSKNGKQTIVPLFPGFRLYSSARFICLPRVDIERINLYYGCEEKRENQTMDCIVENKEQDKGKIITITMTVILLSLAIIIILVGNRRSIQKCTKNFRKNNQFNYRVLFNKNDDQTVLQF